MPPYVRILLLGVLCTALPAMHAHAQQRARPDPDGPLVECALYGAQSSSPYALPYEFGAAFEVWGSTSHYNPGNRGVGLYAIDFVMPIGTAVLAARGGVVVAARDSFPDNNNVDLAENFVFIRHEDGTVARYFHLTKGGALVRAGDRVEQGRRIGTSGNSGQSTGPHLHFDTQQCGPNLPPNYNAAPCGQTVPVLFRNTSAHPCGVIPGTRYRAMRP